MCIRDRSEIADYFTPIREEALKSGLLNPKVLGVNVKTLSLIHIKMCIRDR